MLYTKNNVNILKYYIQTLFIASSIMVVKDISSIFSSNKISWAVSLTFPDIEIDFSPFI